MKIFVEYSTYQRIAPKAQNQWIRTNQKLKITLNTYGELTCKEKENEPRIFSSLTSRQAKKLTAAILGLADQVLNFYGSAKRRSISRLGFFINSLMIDCVKEKEC